MDDVHGVWGDGAMTEDAMRTRGWQPTSKGWSRRDPSWRIEREPDGRWAVIPPPARDRGPRPIDAGFVAELRTFDTLEDAADAADSWERDGGGL